MDHRRGGVGRARRALAAGCRSVSSRSSGGGGCRDPTLARVVEAQQGVATPDDVAVKQAPPDRESLFVDKRAVAREPFVPDHPYVAQAAQLSVEPRNLSIELEPYGTTLATSDCGLLELLVQGENLLPVFDGAIDEERFSEPACGQPGTKLLRRGAMLARGHRRTLANVTEAGQRGRPTVGWLFPPPAKNTSGTHPEWLVSERV